MKKLVARGIETRSLMVPHDFESKISPMDGNVYITLDLHEAHHHYLKVVTTNVDGLKMGNRNLKAYQIIQSSQLSYYRTDIVPEAKVRTCNGYASPCETSFPIKFVVIVDSLFSTFPR